MVMAKFDPHRIDTFQVMANKFGTRDYVVTVPNLVQIRSRRLFGKWVKYNRILYTPILSNMTF